MEKITRRITATSAWSASADLTPVDVPKEGLITEVKVRANLTTAALTKTVDLDGFKKTIQNLKILGDGGRTYLGLSMELAARLLAKLNEYEHQSPFLTPPINIGDTVSHQTFLFHPGSNPRDPFDLSAVIPARAVSTLQILLTTTANTLIDAAAAIASGTFYYEINEVLGVPVPAGIMTPLGSSRFLNPGATGWSDFSYEHDVPTGNWLRRIIILVQDESAHGADDEVTAVKLKLPKAARAQIETTWEELKVETAKLYGYGGEANPVEVTTAEQYPPGLILPVIPKGFAIIDLRKYFHPIWGANLTEYNVGDVKLGFTIAAGGNAGDDVLIYFDQLMPVEAQYVGK